MRTGRVRIAAGALAAFLSACAHIEAPPGGPVDNDPPGILTTRPEAEAVVPTYDGPVVFVFDERISERGIESSVLVSPRTSPVVVSHGRDELRVSLRQGWERDRIYHVMLRPEIVDLFGNRLAGIETLVFSTGPRIPDTRVTGTVVDRLSGRSSAGVRVEAIRTADSLVYAVPTDTVGAFLLQQIPTGEYKLRAFDDANDNRSLEYFEARDSVLVEIQEGDVPELAFRLLESDTTAPVASAPVLDGLSIRIDFDDYLDETLELDAGSITITDSATGETVAIGAVTTGEVPRGDVQADSVAPTRLPSRTLRIELAEGVELAPGTEYSVTVRGVRNVNGLTADVDATVTTPEAPVDPVAVVSTWRPSRYIAPPREGEARKNENLELFADNGGT